LRIAVGTLTGAAGDDATVGLGLTLCDGLADAVGEALAAAVPDEAGVAEALEPAVPDEAGVAEALEPAVPDEAGVAEALEPAVDVGVTVGVGCAGEATAEAVVDGRGVI
jgi:hypothetical protein